MDHTGHLTPKSWEGGAVLALLCPGQGSQRPGMLTSWIQTAAHYNVDAPMHLRAFSDAANLDLIELGTEGDDKTIRDTAHAQPLIVALSLLSYRLVQAASGLRADVVSGHSVGEITALAVAGVISDDEAVKLAAVRGAAMARAAQQANTSMAALVGGKRDDVLATLDEHNLTPANINGATQVVAAGRAADLDALANNLPRACRLIPISVAGAFHTEFMASAVPDVVSFLDGLTPHAPTCTLISNRDGNRVPSGAEALRRIATQMTSPVRWDLCQAHLLATGVTRAIELAPSGVLAGLARRDLQGVATLAVTASILAELPGFLSTKDDS